MSAGVIDVGADAHGDVKNWAATSSGNEGGQSFEVVRRWLFEIVGGVDKFICRAEFM